MSDFFVNTPRAPRVIASAPQPGGIEMPREKGTPIVSEPRAAGSKRTASDIKKARQDAERDRAKALNDDRPPSTVCARCRGAEIDRARYQSYCYMHKREWSQHARAEKAAEVLRAAQEAGEIGDTDLVIDTPPLTVAAKRIAEKPTKQVIATCAKCNQPRGKNGYCRAHNNDRMREARKTKVVADAVVASINAPVRSSILPALVDRVNLESTGMIAPQVKAGDVVSTPMGPGVAQPSPAATEYERISIDFAYGAPLQASEWAEEPRPTRAVRLERLADVARKAVAHLIRDTDPKALEIVRDLVEALRVAS